MTSRLKKSSEQHGAVFAKGGKGGAGKMFKEQSANPQKPAITGHVVKGTAPGASRAAGGPKTTRGASLATPAVPGKTSPVRKAR